VAVDHVEVVELRLRPAAGIAVRLLDADGGPPRLITDTWQLATWLEVELPAHLKSAGWKPLRDALGTAVLAGMNPELCAFPDGALLELFVGEADLPAGASVPIKANAAGYRRVHAEIELRSPGRMQAFDSISLSRASGESALEVRVAGLPECALPTGTVLPVFRLSMRNLDDAEIEAFELVLRPASLEHCVIAGIPPGNYRIQGKALARHLLPAARIMELADGRTCRLDLDAAALGCIVLRPESAPGVEFQGGLQVRIRGERTSRGTPIQVLNFRAPPYTLPFQSPGNCILELISSPSGYGATVTAQASAGGSIEVRALLEPR
jgi:hypothetical protein